jgi:AraC-like DNA-binding protein
MKATIASSEHYPKIYLYKRIVQAKLFIDANFERNIDINLISDEAYFSKFHFIRLFKKVYGKTPHQYLKSVRIAQAVLLFEKGTPVSDTCHSVGFDSLSSFSALFKKVKGTTPSEFLKQQQLRKIGMIENPMHYISACFAHKSGWLKNSNFKETLP